MNSQEVIKFINQIPSSFRVRTWVSSFFLGAGLCYSIENQKYLHIPIVCIAPTAYSGYQLFKNRIEVKNYIAEYNKLNYYDSLMPRKI